MMLHNAIQYFILPMMSLSMLLISIRVFKGPRLMDKVIALDLLMIVSIGTLSAYAILHESEVFVEISLILALIAFLGTVAFTYYYVKGESKGDKFDER